MARELGQSAEPEHLVDGDEIEEELYIDDITQESANEIYSVIHESSTEFGDTMQETRMAVDIFTKTLEVQQKELFEELEELKRMRNDIIPPKVNWSNKEFKFQIEDKMQNELNLKTIPTMADHKMAGFDDHLKAGISADGTITESSVRILPPPKPDENGVGKYNTKLSRMMSNNIITNNNIPVSPASAKASPFPTRHHRHHSSKHHHRHHSSSSLKGISNIKKPSSKVTVGFNDLIDHDHLNPIPKASFNSYLFDSESEGKYGDPNFKVYALKDNITVPASYSKPNSQANPSPHAGTDISDQPSSPVVTNETKNHSPNSEAPKPPATFDTVRCSYWHQIPLSATTSRNVVATGSFHFVCEMPKYSSVCLEVDTQAEMNPAVTEVYQKKAKHLSRPFMFNYGAFPRTWFSPAQEYFHMGSGYNDQLDVVEIGTRTMKPGDICRVKVLGVLVLSRDDDDEDDDLFNAGRQALDIKGEDEKLGDFKEADFKIIAIDETDRWAADIKDIRELEKLRPGILDRIRNWFLVEKKVEEFVADMKDPSFSKFDGNDDDEKKEEWMDVGRERSSPRTILINKTDEGNASSPQNEEKKRPTTTDGGSASRSRSMFSKFYAPNAAEKTPADSLPPLETETSSVFSFLFNRPPPPLIKTASYNEEKNRKKRRPSLGSRKNSYSVQMEVREKYVEDEKWFDSRAAEEVRAVDVEATHIESEHLKKLSPHSKFPIFGPLIDELKVWGLLTQEEQHRKKAVVVLGREIEKILLADNFHYGEKHASGSVSITVIKKYLAPEVLDLLDAVNNGVMSLYDQTQHNPLEKASSLLNEIRPLNRRTSSGRVSSPSKRKSAVRLSVDTESLQCNNEGFGMTASSSSGVTFQRNKSPARVFNSTPIRDSPTRRPMRTSIALQDDQKLNSGIHRNSVINASLIQYDDEVYDELEHFAFEKLVIFASQRKKTKFEYSTQHQGKNGEGTVITAPRVKLTQAGMKELHERKYNQRYGSDTKSEVDANDDQNKKYYHNKFGDGSRVINIKEEIKHILAGTSQTLKDSQAKYKKEEAKLEAIMKKKQEEDEEEEEYVLDQSTADQFQGLSPNRYYGPSVAACVLRRAHIGWRSVLKVHHPDHPLNCPVSTTIDSLNDICKQVGIDWLKPPTAATSSTSNTLPSPHEDKHLSTDELPPVVWLLWVCPMESLDIQSIENDQKAIEMFAKRERDKVIGADIAGEMDEAILKERNMMNLKSTQVLKDALGEVSGKKEEEEKNGGLKSSLKSSHSSDVDFDKVVDKKDDKNELLEFMQNVQRASLMKFQEDAIALVAAGKQKNNTLKKKQHRGKTFNEMEDGSSDSGSDNSGSTVGSADDLGSANDLNKLKRKEEKMLDTTASVRPFGNKSNDDDTSSQINRHHHRRNSHEKNNLKVNESALNPKEDKHHRMDDNLRKKIDGMFNGPLSVETYEQGLIEDSAFECYAYIHFNFKTDSTDHIHKRFHRIHNSTRDDKSKKLQSYWHDIPLTSKDILHKHLFEDVTIQDYVVDGGSGKASPLSALLNDNNAANNVHVLDDNYHDRFHESSRNYENNFNQYQMGVQDMMRDEQLVQTMKAKHEKQQQAHHDDHTIGHQKSFETVSSFGEEGRETPDSLPLTPPRMLSPRAGTGPSLPLQRNIRSPQGQRGSFFNHRASFASGIDRPMARRSSMGKSPSPTVYLDPRERNSEINDMQNKIHSPVTLKNNSHYKTQHNQFKHYNVNVKQQNSGFEGHDDDDDDGLFSIITPDESYVALNSLHARGSFLLNPAEVEALKPEKPVQITCDPDKWVPRGSVHWVCECSANTTDRLRVNIRKKNNPIMRQEDGNKFERPLNYNIGFLPRTWQDPSFAHPHIKGGHSIPYTQGANLPLCAIEVGTQAFRTGTVRSVKVLGVFPVLDEIHLEEVLGEVQDRAKLEWVLVVIDELDLWARELQNVDQLEELCNGSIENIRGTVRDYISSKRKCHFEAGEDPFLVIGPALNGQFGLGVIRTAFHCYKRLLMLNWDAAEDEEDESDDDSVEGAVLTAAKTKVAPSVWLLEVPEVSKPRSIALEADEFALLRITDGILMDQSLQSTVHPEVQKCEKNLLLLASAEARRLDAKDKHLERELIKSKKRAELTKPFAVKMFVKNAMKLRGLSKAEALREHGEMVKKEVELSVKEDDEEDIYDSDEERADLAICMQSETYQNALKVKGKDQSCLFQLPMNLDDLKLVQNLSDIVFVDTRASELKDPVEARRMGSVPLWLTIPGVWPLEQYVQVRSMNPKELVGKRIVVIDSDGRQSSLFLANQAKYHPRLARRTELLLMDEAAATWFMNPRGRYLQWFVRRNDFPVLAFKWTKTAMQQRDKRDGKTVVL